MGWWRSKSELAMFSAITRMRACWARSAEAATDMGRRWRRWARRARGFKTPEPNPHGLARGQADQAERLLVEADGGVEVASAVGHLDHLLLEHDRVAVHRVSEWGSLTGEATAPCRRAGSMWIGLVRAIASPRRPPGGLHLGEGLEIRGA